MDALENLIGSSLTMWSRTHSVHRDGIDDHIIIRAEGDVVLTIDRAPKGMPFRWVVETRGRKRTAASVVGVLRIVRQNLAPRYQPYQLTIAPLPGLPS